MRKSLFVTAITIALAPHAALALGHVSCFPEGAGVGGAIIDQYDIVEAINCLGKQIAAVNNRSANQQAIEAQQREIIELQRALNDLSRQVEELKAARQK